MSNKQNSLVLFLKGFPEALHPDQLRLLLAKVNTQSAREAGCGTGSVGSCKIVRIVSPKDKQIEHYALVELKPARCALACIRALDGKYCAGMKIIARRYRQRSMLYERRQDTLSLGDIKDRRGRDRRRDGLQIEAVDSASSKIVATMMRAFRSRPTFELSTE